MPTRKGPLSVEGVLGTQDERLRALEIHEHGVPRVAEAALEVVRENIDWFIDLVLDGGAMGDGVSNDTGAVYTALDLANTTGKAILVRPGYTFKIDDVLISNPTVFQGFGAGSSVFKRADSSSMFNIQADAVEFHNIEFDNNLQDGSMMKVTNGNKQKWLFCSFSQPGTGGTAHFLEFSAGKGSTCLMQGCDLPFPTIGGYNILLPTDSSDQDRRFVQNNMASVRSFNFGGARATLVQGNTLGPMTMLTTGRGLRLLGNYVGSTTGVTFSGDRNIIKDNFFPGTTVTLSSFTTGIYKNNLHSGFSDGSSGSIVGENI